jgi:hypothetical protein
LSFILDRFQDQLIFPSSLSTKTTKGRQILVDSDKEALARFAQANFLSVGYRHILQMPTENASVTQRLMGLHTATPTQPHRL